MSGFPEGDFRIINDDSGLAIFVSLGSQTTYTYQRLGNETNYVVSDKPTIGVRPASGGAEEAWYFDKGADGWGRAYAQIVSVVVGRTNLGNYGITRSYNPIEPAKSKVYMYGCGAIADSRWQTADGYIWAVDSEHAPQEQTYLSLAGGVLTIRPKGVGSQRWRFEAPK